MRSLFKPATPNCVNCGYPFENMKEEELGLVGEEPFNAIGPEGGTVAYCGEMCKQDDFEKHFEELEVEGQVAFQRAMRLRRAGAPEGQWRSILDPRHAYSSDGRQIGTIGQRCEDAPCCGCCD